jgi:hypothetical protein
MADIKQANNYNYHKNLKFPKAGWSMIIGGINEKIVE